MVFVGVTPMPAFMALETLPTASWMPLRMGRNMETPGKQEADDKTQD